MCAHDKPRPIIIHFLYDTTFKQERDRDSSSSFCLNDAHLCVSLYTISSYNVLTRKKELLLKQLLVYGFLIALQRIFGSLKGGLGWYTSHQVPAWDLSSLLYSQVHQLFMLRYSISSFILEGSYILKQILLLVIVKDNEVNKSQ